MTGDGAISPPRKILLVALLLFPLLSIPCAVAAQDDAYEPASLDLTVYRDGVTRVQYSLNVNSTWPTIDLPLFGGGFEDLMVLDEDGIVLSYSAHDSSLEVYTLGASTVNIEYYTQDLTSKQGGLWSLSIDTPIDFEVKLPEGSTVIDLTSTPIEIRTEDGGPALTMPAGTQVVTYILGVASEDSGQPFFFPILITIGVVVGGVIGGLGFVFRRRTARLRWDALAKQIMGKHPDLRPDERSIINFLAVSGGAALEAHIRNALGLPKSTAWRVIKALEEKGIVVVEQLGQQNYIKLRRNSANSSGA